MASSLAQHNPRGGAQPADRGSAIGGKPHLLPVLEAFIERLEQALAEDRKLFADGSVAV